MPFFHLTIAKTKFLTEHLVSWMMLLVSLPLCTYVLYHTRETNYDVEKVIHVEDLAENQIHSAAVPKGHHVDEGHVAVEQVDEKKGAEDGALVSSV